MFLFFWVWGSHFGLPLDDEPGPVPRVAAQQGQGGPGLGRRHQGVAAQGAALRAAQLDRSRGVDQEDPRERPQDPQHLPQQRRHDRRSVPPVSLPALSWPSALDFYVDVSGKGINRFGVVVFQAV